MNRERLTENMLLNGTLHMIPFILIIIILRYIFSIHRCFISKSWLDINKKTTTVTKELIRQTQQVKENRLNLAKET